MDKLKILFITQDFTHFIDPNWEYFQNELGKIAELRVWKKSGNIKDILNCIDIIPDFILLNDTLVAYCPTITGLESISIPFGIVIGDVDPFVMEDRKSFITKNKVKYVFYIYRDRFLELFPELDKENIFWLPHFVSTEIFKDYGLKKEINFLMMGMIHHWYPLRKKMLKSMENEEGFIYHKHPGYETIDASTAFVREKYAMEINRSKIFLTDDSIFHYPLIKYYEVLACKTLLLASYSKELRDLGFIPGIHFVAIDEENFLRKAKYYLVHEREREEIIERGYEMVCAKHSAAVRAAEFLTMVQSIVE